MTLGPAQGVDVVRRFDWACGSTAVNSPEVTWMLGLPPDSPNLNLIERLWRFVKKECPAVRCRADFAEFRAAIDGCLGELPTKHHAAMRSLLTPEFQAFEDVTVLAA
jgi:hypothetical protein